MVNVLTTYGGAPTTQAPNQGVQRFHLSEQFAILLGSNTDTMLVLGPYVAKAVDLDDYVAAFLQPPSGGAGFGINPHRVFRIL